MHEVCFVCPPGFELVGRHRFAGDVALLFRKGRRESLLVRQVYPGDLALRRRTTERWLEAYPFKEHRRLRKASSQIEDWTHERRPELTGIRRRGRKRLGIPLGWMMPQ